MSLPKGCNFQIISFGNDYRLMFNEFTPYTNESMQKAKE